MKAIEPYFPVVLFIILYKVVLTCEFVDEILKCDHPNESFRAELSCDTVYCAVQGGGFWVFEWILKCDHCKFYYTYILTTLDSVNESF